MISIGRLWKAMAKDSHNLMPKLLPDIISSIVILQEDGGVGTIRQSNFSPAIKEFSYWKDRVDAVDDQKHIFKYSVIEGGLIGKKVKSTSFELKFNEATDGGSVCKLSGEYETIEDRLPTEEETKEMIGGMIGMFKAVEGYLLANPDAYA
ncbi:hypothetical protein MRB53_008492 [Persea americana]|uniref:Uncharacterized protein n=1 Tax=Persea americana TaxID=3435 RepID=A0ACC2MM86_PERAE|nr:hypothetical protein MRB53_008492 [Persea americana]